MGTSTSGAELAAKFGRLAKDMADVGVPLNRTGLHVKRVMERSAAAAGVLGRKPSGKRKPVGVRYNLRARADGQGTMVVSYTGAAHLFNNPTGRHFIGPSGFGSVAALQQISQGVGAVTAFGGTARGMFSAGSGRRFQVTRSGSLVRRRARGGARALTIGGDLRAWAFHPGTPGKRFFQHAKARATATAPAVYARSGLTEPLRRAFAA